MNDVLHRPQEDAPDAVLTQLVPKVHSWVYRAMGPQACVDDVTQDALIEIARALPHFRGDAALETFAYRITVRVASRSFKKAQRREVPLELVPPHLDSVDPRSQIASRELVRALYRALDKLTPIRRMAFVLCELEGMTPTEAAAVLGKRPATVRSRLRRARVELEAHLHADGVVMPLGGNP